MPLSGDTLARVVVVGTSGCGKTHFAQRLAERLGSPHIELDAILWGPDCTALPAAEFRGIVELIAQAPRWVADGNDGSAHDVLWPRATAVVWLNYGFATVLLRSRKSMLLEVLRTFHRRRREYGMLRASGRFAQLEWLELRRPEDAERFLAGVRGRSWSAAARPSGRP